MTRPSVVVCTPWIDTGCQWREKARDWTASHWAEIGVPVVYGHSTELNRARARNAAARGIEADVLFFADADMWVSEEQFWEAVERSYDTGSLVHAYVKHTRLNKWSTEQIYAGRNSLQGQTILGCSSGAIAVRKDTHDLVGGHDERFVVWGGEDRSFQFACDVLAGPGQRVNGTSWHLWHPRDPVLSRNTPERKAGMALAQRYKRAAGITTRSGIVAPTKGAVRDPDAMRAILREPGGPLASLTSSHA